MNQVKTERLESMKGKFKFIAVDRTSEVLGITKFGKLYETDENGVITLEDGNRIITCGDYERFARGVALWCEKHIKIDGEYELARTMALIDSQIKTGDKVVIGDSPVEYEFICWGKDQAIIRNGDFYTTLAPYCLRKVGNRHGEAAPSEE